MSTIKKYEENIIANRNSNPKQYYNYVSKDDKYSEPNLTLQDGDELVTNEGKCADILVQYFSSVFNRGGSNLAIYLSIIREIEEMPDIEITHRAVLNMFLELDTTKASGLYEIPALILKKFAHLHAPALTIIFTRSYEEGVVPRTMKVESVKPLHKSGDKSDPSNYRPISLTPIIGKIFERIVKRSIEEHLTNHEILSEH